MKRTIAGLAAVMTCLGITPLPGAASIRMDVNTVVLSRENRVQDITLTNSEDVERVGEVKLTTWHEDSAGKPIEAASSDLVAVPRVFRLAAHGTQVVRVGLREDPQADVERSYRLAVKEVAANVAARQAGVAMTISLPVFVKPAQPQPQTLKWKLARVDDQHADVTVVNDANVHVLLDGVTISDDVAGRDTISTVPLDYLLAKSSRTVRVDVRHAAAGVLVARYTSKGKALSAPVAVQP